MGSRGFALVASLAGGLLASCSSPSGSSPAWNASDAGAGSDDGAGGTAQDATMEADAPTVDGSAGANDSGTTTQPPAPATRMTVEGGNFYFGDTLFRPTGVNYMYPHYSQPFYADTERDWVTVWDSPEFPDIHAAEEIEADFALMEQKGINEIRLAPAQAYTSNMWDPASYPSPERSYCARLAQLLDMAGSHGIHVTMYLPFNRTNSGGNYAVAGSPDKADSLVEYAVRVIDACQLSSRSEIMGWEIDGEGEVESPSSPKMMTRGKPDAVGLWNDWLTDRYGSPQKAEARWGEKLPRECTDVEVDSNGTPVTNGCPDLEVWDKGCKAHGTRVCPPRLLEGTDAQGDPDARWGPDTNAKRAFVRFTDWVMNKRTQRIRERILRHDPWHLLVTDSILQDGYCSKAIFLRREQTKYLDYSGVHIYHHQYTGGTWDSSTFGTGNTFDKLKGTAAALAWMNPERRPVVVGEVGVSVLPCASSGFCIQGTESQRTAVQKSLLSFETAISAAGGARGYRWWWWRGVRPMGTYPDPANPRDREVSDYGVLAAGGTARPILDAFASTEATYGAIDATPSSEYITHVFDPSPSCSAFILDDASRLEAIAAVLGKKPFRARTICSGKDTTSAPNTGPDGKSYFTGCAADDSEHCTPLTCVDAMFETVEVLDASGQWADARDGKQVTVARDTPVRVRVSVGNVGESRWNASSTEAGRAKIALSGSGLATTRVALPASIASFDSTEVIEFSPYVSLSAPTTFRMRMVAEQRMFFGESVTVSLTVAE